MIDQEKREHKWQTSGMRELLLICLSVYIYYELVMFPFFLWIFKWKKYHEQPYTNKSATKLNSKSEQPIKKQNSLKKGGSKKRGRKEGKKEGSRQADWEGFTGEF